MANELLKFKKGLHANLAKQAKVAGTVYVTTDEQAMYVDIDSNTRIRLSDIIQVDTVNKLRDMAPKYSSTALYYVIDENALLKYTGDGSSNHTWKQINSVSDVTANLEALEKRVSDNEKAIGANADAIEKLNTTVYGSADGKTETDDGLVKKVEALEAADVTIKADVKANADNITTINGEITTIKGDITAVDGRVTTLETELPKVSNRVGTLETWKGTANTDIANLKSSVGADTSDPNGSGTVYERLANLRTQISSNDDDILALQNKDTAIESRVTENEKSIGTINGSITTINNSISGLDTRLTTAESDIDALETWKGTASTDISGLKTTVAGHGTTLDGHTTSIGQNAAAITELDGRVDAAEGEIDTLQGLVGTSATTGLRGAVAALQEADTEIRGLISTNAGAIEDLEGDLEGLTKTVSDNGSAISTLNGKVSGLEGWKTTAEGQISALQSKDTELAGKITAIVTKNGTQDGLISDNANAISALDTRVTDAETAITNLSNNKVDKTTYDADKAALEKKITDDINAANAMRFISSTATALPTTVTAADKLQVGDTYVASTGFTQGSVPVNPGDLLIAKGTETNGYIVGAVEWQIVDTGYNDSHENKIVADAANSAVKLQSYLGSDLASVAFAGEGAARVAVTGTGNASTVTVSVVWDDFT